MQVWGVWIRDLDLSSKLISLWSTEIDAIAECRKLQKAEVEVAYFISDHEVKSKESEE